METAEIAHADDGGLQRSHRYLDPIRRTRKGGTFWAASEEKTSLYISQPVPRLRSSQDQDQEKDGILLWVLRCSVCRGGVRATTCWFGGIRGASPPPQRRR